MDESTGAQETPAPSHFVGREAELAYLADWVRPHHVLALVGDRDAEGLGATALARAYAASSGAELVLTWSIPEDGPRPHVALRRWAEGMGLEAAGLALQSDLLDTVAAGLSGRAGTLLVIDGVREEDMGSVAQVLTLRSLDVAVLLTCPAASVAQRLGARPVVVEPLLEEEGQAMLEAVVESAVPPIIALTILQAVDYLPLGIRLAGSRIRHARADESSGLWGGKLDPERVAWLGGAPGVARAFLDAYRRLDDDAKRAFRAVGAVRYGPVRASRLAPLLDEDEAGAASRLEHLAAYGLIDPREGAGGWCVHPVLGTFARRLAEETGEGEVWRRRRLSAVIAADGRSGPGVDAADVLDVIETTLAEGTTDDLVALATRVAEQVRGWCHEEAADLVARALEAARQDGHRAAGMLQRVHDALRDERARSDAEDLLDMPDALVEVEALPDDEIALDEPSGPTPSEGSGLALDPSPSLDDAFLVAHGLTLDDGEDELQVEAEPELEALAGEIPTQVFDVRKLLAHGGGTSAEDGRQRATEAAARAEEVHQQAMELVASAVSDAGASPDPVVARALDALVAATRKVTEQVRRARTAASAAEVAEPALVARAADRATRARDAAGHAMAVVEAAWAGVHDAMAEAAEARAQRMAASRTASRDVAVARQALDEASKRLQTRRAAVDDEGSTWGELEELLRDAGAWLTEAEDLTGSIDAGVADPEDAGAEVRSLRERVEEAARDVLGRASRRLRAVRAEEQREDVLREARQQLGRFEQDADWVHALCDELGGRLEGHDDAESLELRARITEIRTEIRMHRDTARDAARRLEDAAEATWLGLLERISTSTRAVAAALSDTERLRVDVDTWVADHVVEDPEIVLAALRADAANALATLESTAAVARRAVARAGQALAHAELPELVERTHDLREREGQVRDLAAAARAALQGVVDGVEVKAAREAWRGSQAVLADAQAAADHTRRLAEEILAVADGDRRARLTTATEEGAAIAERVAAAAAQANEALEEVRGALERVDDAELGARCVDVAHRAEAARHAAEDGMRRLGQTRDPAFAERVVEAMHDAADVVAAALVEAEALRSRAAGLVAEASTPERRLARLQDRLVAARASLEALRADVGALVAEADGPLRAVVRAATSEARREAEEGLELLAELAPDPGDPDGWQDAEELVEVVEGLADRSRAGLLSARSLVEAALERRRQREHAEAGRVVLPSLPAVEDEEEEATAIEPAEAEPVAWRDRPPAPGAGTVAAVRLAATVDEDDDGLDPTDIVAAADLVAPEPAGPSEEELARAAREEAERGRRREEVAGHLERGRTWVTRGEDLAREAFGLVAAARQALEAADLPGADSALEALTAEARAVRAVVAGVEDLLDGVPADADPAVAAEVVVDAEAEVERAAVLLEGVRTTAAALTAEADGASSAVMERVRARGTEGAEVVAEARALLVEAQARIADAAGLEEVPEVAELLSEVEEGMGAVVGLVEAGDLAVERVRAASALRDAEEAATEASAVIAILPDARDVLQDTLAFLAEAIERARSSERVEEELPEVVAEPLEEELPEVVAEPLEEELPEVVAEPLEEELPEVVAEARAADFELDGDTDEATAVGALAAWPPPAVVEDVAPPAPQEAEGSALFIEDDELEVSEIRELFAAEELLGAHEAVAGATGAPGVAATVDEPSEAPADEPSEAPLDEPSEAPLDEPSASISFDLDGEAPATFQVADPAEPDGFEAELLAALHAAEAEVSAARPGPTDEVEIADPAEPDGFEAELLAALHAAEAEVEAAELPEAEVLEVLPPAEELPELEAEALDPLGESGVLVLSADELASCDERVAVAARAADAAYLPSRGWGGDELVVAARARALLAHALEAYEAARQAGAPGLVVAGVARIEELSRSVRLLSAAIRPPELDAPSVPLRGVDRRDRAGELLAQLTAARLRVLASPRSGSASTLLDEAAGARAALGAVYDARAPGHAEALARLQRVVERLADLRDEPPAPVAAPRRAAEAFDEARAARPGGDVTAFEAAARAVSVAGSAGSADSRAALRLQLARAALAVGEREVAGRALAEARALASAPEVLAISARLEALLVDVPQVPGAPASWVAAAESLRRARRTIGP